MIRVCWGLLAASLLLAGSPAVAQTEPTDVRDTIAYRILVSCEGFCGARVGYYNNLARPVTALRAD